MSKTSIKVSIAGREYPLTVNEGEETNVFKAAELLNAKLKEFEANYAIRDKQDLLAMCALQVSAQYILGENKKVDKKAFWSKLVELDTLVSSYLDENKSIP
jgi:cell division protein ZapA (FtsZ GTPase activity inhibitor)